MQVNDREKKKKKKKKKKTFGSKKLYVSTVISNLLWKK